jgi:hypothetical protein
MDYDGNKVELRYFMTKEIMVYGRVHGSGEKMGIAVVVNCKRLQMLKNGAIMKLEGMRDG